MLRMLLVLSPLLVGCVVDDGVFPDEIVVSNSSGTPGLAWVLSGDPDLPTLRYDGDEAFVGLGFDLAVLGTTGVASFQDNFELANVTLYDTGRTTDGSVFSWSLRDSLQSMQFDSFVGDRLGWELDVHVDRITEHRTDHDDPDCITDDMMGICAFDEPADEDVHLVFDLSVAPAP